MPANHRASVCAAALVAFVVNSAPALAQDAGSLALPPPPPEDPRVDPAVTSAASAAVTSAAPTPAIPVVRSVAVQPAPTGAAPLAPPPPRASRTSRAARTLSHLQAVVADEAESDAQQRRSMGTALLIGGALSASTAAIPFLLPHGSLSTLSTIVISSTSIAAGSAFALMGTLLMLTRSPWEQMAQELRDDPVSDPEARLQAALVRWSQRAERERAAQRAGAITIIGLGVFSAGLGVVSVATNGASAGLNVAIGIPALLLGCAYVPIGAAMLGMRTPSERALRVFRLSQGQRMSALDGARARVLGVAPTLNGAAIYGAF